jgi:hypothetical protein
VALVVTIGVMIQTSRRQLRAYVFPESAGLFEGTMATPPMPEHTNKPGIILNFKNSGQTPAYKVVSWAQIDVLPRDQEPRLIAPPLVEQFTTNIGPGSVMPKTLWATRPLTPDEITEVLHTTKIIYVYGRIEYQDAFSRKRWTNFRLAYAGRFPPPPGVIFSVAEKGNDAN